MKWPGWEGNWLAPRKGKAPRTRDYDRKGEQTHEEWLLQGPAGPNFGKNAVFFEYGTMRAGQGARTDLQEFYQHVKAGKIDILVFLFSINTSGKKDTELADINFSCFSRTLKAIDRIRMQNKPDRTEPREIILLQGKPGKGKTRLAYEEQDVYETPIGNGGNDLWFDGYFGQKTALLDEFEGTMKLDAFLKLIDNYYVRAVPIKGINY